MKSKHGILKVWCLSSASWVPPAQKSILPMRASWTFHQASYLHSSCFAMEQYEKKEILGQGQFGIVFKAKHKEVLSLPSAYMLCAVLALMNFEFWKTCSDCRQETLSPSREYAWEWQRRSYACTLYWKSAMARTIIYWSPATCEC